MKQLDPLAPPVPIDQSRSCARAKPDRKAALAALRAARKQARAAQAEERAKHVAEALAPPASLPGKLGLTVASLIIWWHLYQLLPLFARFTTQTVCKLDPVSPLGTGVEYFFFNTPKVLLLLSVVVFGVGIIRSFFTLARTRRWLSGKSEAVGNVLAAFLGSVTPFCSRSVALLFTGFLGAGVSLGVTFSFLLAAPLVNEIIVVLLYVLAGWKVAASYMGAGFVVAMVSGFVIGRFKMVRHVEDWALAVRVDGREVGGENAGEGAGENDFEEPDWAARLNAGAHAVRERVGKAWPWIMLGIAVGAGIHGYVPEDFLASPMGREAWWSVPAAVLLGVPMSFNAAAIVPAASALLEKGAALGTVLAFMLSGIALALPRLVHLRKVLKLRLIFVFASVIGAGILLVGILFNAVL
jgi:uncharacterized protein